MIKICLPAESTLLPSQSQSGHIQPCLLSLSRGLIPHNAPGSTEAISKIGGRKGEEVSFKARYPHENTAIIGRKS